MIIVKVYPQRMTDMSLTNIVITMFEALTFAIRRKGCLIYHQLTIVRPCKEEY